MKKWMLVLVVAALVIGGYFWNRQKRELASAEPGIKLESAQIKTQMIQSLNWKDEGDHVAFQIESQDPEFCTQWSEAKVTLAAEGMGVSGESPGAQAMAKCEQGRIEMSWPKDIGSWNESIQKTGDYIETPSQFYVASVELSGAKGEMRISSYEISAIRNQKFELDLNPPSAP
jgi:hypothetical protein